MATIRPAWTATKTRRSRCRAGSDRSAVPRRDLDGDGPVSAGTSCAGSRRRSCTARPGHVTEHLLDVHPAALEGGLPTVATRLLCLHMRITLPDTPGVSTSPSDRVGSGDGPAVPDRSQSRYGTAVQVAPGIRRVVARNPSKYTPVGDRHLPGRHGRAGGHRPRFPTDAAHVGGGSRRGGATPADPSARHPHARRPLPRRKRCGRDRCPDLRVRPAPPGADDESEEHGDTTFVPDVAVRDGDVVEAPGSVFECLHTPRPHLQPRLLLRADPRRPVPGDPRHGWSTPISPPDGRIATTWPTSRRLLDRTEGRLLPDHGPPIETPPVRRRPARAPAGAGGARFARTGSRWSRHGGETSSRCSTRTSRRSCTVRRAAP